MTELAEKYIDGTANASELTEIEQKLKEDAAFKEEVTELKAITTILKAEHTANLYNELDNLFEEVVRPELHQEKQEKKAKRRSLFSSKQLLLIAASVSLLLVAIFALENLNTSQENLYADHYKPFKAVATRNNASVDDYSKAVTLYQAKEYDKALPILNQALLDETAPKGQLYVMMGNIYLELDQTEKAISAFQNTPATSEYAEDANWYLALAYLKADQKEEAIKLLQEIAKSGVLYHEKAAKLLEE